MDQQDCGLRIAMPILCQHDKYASRTDDNHVLLKTDFPRVLISKDVSISARHHNMQPSDSHKGSRTPYDEPRCLMQVPDCWASELLLFVRQLQLPHDSTEI